MATPILRNPVIASSLKNAPRNDGERVRCFKTRYEGPNLAEPEPNRCCVLRSTHYVRLPFYSGESDRVENKYGRIKKGVKSCDLEKESVETGGTAEH
jgi:hypothetical protein